MFQGASLRKLLAASIRTGLRSTTISDRGDQSIDRPYVLWEEKKRPLRAAVSDTHRAGVAVPIACVTDQVLQTLQVQGRFLALLFL